MKIKVTLLSFLYTCFFMPLMAGDNRDKIAKSKIDQVVIFLNGAQISRTATVALNEGINFVYFKNLSDKISEHSIQPQIIGNARVLAIDYITKIETSGKKDSLMIDLLNDSISGVQKELNKIAYIEATYLEEKKMFELNKTINDDKSPGGPVMEMQKLSALISTRLLEVNKQLYLLGESKLHWDKKISIYQNKITLLKSEEKSATIHSIKLSIYCDLAATATINLKYLVGGAAWTPKYNISVEDVNSQISMDYNAGVMNQSGEDWIGVPLTLSTKDPNKSNDLAALTPWTIDRKTRTTDEGILNTYGSKKVATTENGKTALKELEGVSFETIELPAEDVDFKIAERYDIPSDSKPYLVNIAKNKMKASFQYFCVPKLEKDAFLYAQITGWDKLNLIEGPANIYFQGKFMGESTIAPQYANDTLDISLSRDSKIYINRIKLEDKSERKILGNDKFEKLTYRITVRNTNQVPITMNIEDQVPIADDQSVKVDVLETSKAIYEQQSGSLKGKVFSFNHVFHIGFFLCKIVFQKVSCPSKPGYCLCVESFLVRVGSVIQEVFLYIANNIFDLSLAFWIGFSA